MLKHYCRIGRNSMWVARAWMEPKNQTAPLRNKIYNKKDFSKQYRKLFTRKNSCNN